MLNKVVFSFLITLFLGCPLRVECAVTNTTDVTAMDVCQPAADQQVESVSRVLSLRQLALEVAIRDERLVDRLAANDYFFARHFEESLKVRKVFVKRLVRHLPFVVKVLACYGYPVTRRTLSDIPGIPDHEGCKEPVVWTKSGGHFMFKEQRRLMSYPALRESTAEYEAFFTSDGFKCEREDIADVKKLPICEYPSLDGRDTSWSRLGDRYLEVRWQMGDRYVDVDQEASDGYTMQIFSADKMPLTNSIKIEEAYEKVRDWEYSPDGKMLFVLNWDTQLKVYKACSGRLVMVNKFHSNAVLDWCAWSATGKYMYYGYCGCGNELGDVTVLTKGGARVGERVHGDTDRVKWSATDDYVSIGEAGRSCEYENWYVVDNVKVYSTHDFKQVGETIHCDPDGIFWSPKKNAFVICGESYNRLYRSPDYLTVPQLVEIHLKKDDPQLRGHNNFVTNYVALVKRNPKRLLTEQEIEMEVEDGPPAETTVASAQKRGLKRPRQGQEPEDQPEIKSAKNSG